MPVFIDPRVSIDLVHDLGYAIDCRMLFLGDYVRQLVRVYQEIVYRFSHIKDPLRLYDNLISSAEIQQFYEVRRNDANVTVTLRDDFFRQKKSTDSVIINLNVTGPKGSLKQPFPLSRLSTLGVLLPLLYRGYDDAAIDSTLNAAMSSYESNWALNLLAEMKEKSFLNHNASKSNYFLRSNIRPRITFMGHSSIFVQSNDTSLLIDPCLRLRFLLSPKAFDIVNLNLGAICCSHSHWDHCDLQTLLLFNKDTPVVVPRVRNPTAFNPPMVESLKILGFQNILEAEVWKPVSIGDIELIPVPFHGEQDEPDAEIDHFTYVVKTGGLSFYGGVDCFQDTFGHMKPVLERVREEYQPALSFLPVSKMIYHYQYGGVNGFCRYLDSNLLNQSFQYTASAQDAADWLSILGARWVVPYATFTYPRWSAPLEVANFAKELRARGLQERFFPMRPLDAFEGTVAQAHRKALVFWFKFGGGLNKIDRRLRRRRSYRFLRKLVIHLFSRNIDAEAHH